jgi:hypothetical protein
MKTNFKISQRLRFYAVLLHDTALSSTPRLLPMVFSR